MVRDSVVVLLLTFTVYVPGAIAGAVKAREVALAALA